MVFHRGLSLFFFFLHSDNISTIAFIFFFFVITFSVSSSFLSHQDSSPLSVDDLPSFFFFQFLCRRAIQSSQRIIDTEFGNGHTRTNTAATPKGSALPLPPVLSS